MPASVVTTVEASAEEWARIVALHPEIVDPHHADKES